MAHSATERRASGHPHRQSPVPARAGRLTSSYPRAAVRATCPPSLASWSGTCRSRQTGRACTTITSMAPVTRSSSSRVRNTWGALCDLVQTFRREQRAPDALIVAHYNWPLIFDSGVGYAPDLDALLDLLLLHRAPPSAGGENETLPATCVICSRRRSRRAPAVPPRAATVGSLLWVGQTHIASLPYHSAFKRLQGNSSWRQAQAKAYTGVEERMRARYAGAGTAPPDPSRRRLAHDRWSSHHEWRHRRRSPEPAHARSRALPRGGVPGDRAEHAQPALPHHPRLGQRVEEAAV